MKRLQLAVIVRKRSVKQDTEYRYTDFTTRDKGCLDGNERIHNYYESKLKLVPYHLQTRN